MFCALRGLALRAAPILIALASLRCGEAASRLGPDRDRAADQADQALGAVAARFGPVELEPRLEELRPRLTTAFFIPSRVFPDESAWTGSSGGVRWLGLRGESAGDVYRLGLAPAPPAPLQPGDYRGRLALERLEEHEFEWRWHDELALGDASPETFAAALGAMLDAAGTPGADLRGRLLAALPRTSASLGRLATLRSLAAEPREDGATMFEARFSLEPARIRDELPAYARYLDKYMQPVEMRIACRDGDAGPWWTLDLRELRFTFRMGLHGPALAPLSAPPRRIPEKLDLDVDLSTKSGLFRVGFRRLATDLRLLRAPGAKAFRAVWRVDPDWRIPFLFEPFLKGALSRPLEGEGVWLEVSLAREPGAPTTILSSQFHMVVEEAWIIRRLGGLVTGAVSAFREDVEAEADRYHGEVLEAARADAVELLRGDGPPGASD